MAPQFTPGDSPRLDHESQDSSAEKTAENVLAEARARLEQAQEAETEIRRLALEDLEFRAGKQWPDAIQADRERDGRPCLVINRLPQFVQQVTNDQRQNRPAIKVHPVGDGADVETAKVIQGLIRHIEYNSNAEVAYDTAFESAATGGFGYFRILTDFADPNSFEQDILIKRIRNPFSVFFDPYASEPDGSDAGWAIIVDDLSAEDYRAKYPDSKLSATGTDWDSIGNQAPGWVKSDSARVAEYFYKEMREGTLHLLSTGETVKAEDLEAVQYANPMAQVVRSRKTKTPVIHWIKMNGIEILEQTEWPGSFIPIIPVYGAELYINGKRVLESVIRHAKDAQRMYNYWKSSETEAIALAPRTPFIVAEGQLEGYEGIWATANRKNHSYLPYKPTSSSGQQVPMPQRQAFEPAVQAITNAAMFAAEDLKSTTGIYDASLGAQSNEKSGIAIQRRNNQAQTSNFHFTDNLTRSMRHAGRVLVDLIPKIYDTARAARIIGDDGEQKIVMLNQPTGELGKDGQELIYQLDTGRYDVTVDTGPSFASKRQEAAASMMEVSRAVPQLVQVAGDLMVKNMDWPGSQELSDRLKKMLPPGLADDQKQAPIPPQVQAQMQQQQHMIDQLTQHLHETSQIVETKRMELESRERIEMAKLQVQAEMKLAELGTRGDVELLKHEIAALNNRLSMIGMNEPMDTETDPSESAGGMSASMAPEGSQPTGGFSPGSPMEGF